MNNHRLLTVVFAMTLLSMGSLTYAQTEHVMTLEELFETAETSSLRLKPSFTAQEESSRAVKVAQSAMLPEINASLSLNYLGDGFTTKRNFKDYHQAPIPHLGTGLSVSVNQPVYTGGAITNGIELAKLKTTASGYATELKRDNIRFELAGFYLELYKCRNLRNVVEQNLELARKMLEEMMVRYDQGVALKNDITRYELLTADLELQLIKLDNMAEILNRNLVTVAGLPEETRVLPDTTILTRSLPTESEEWWKSEARVNSPAIRLASSGVEIAERGLRLIKSECLPKIGLQAGWTIDGPILVEVPPINRNLSYWYVGVGVSYDVSSLYKMERRLKESTLSLKRSVEELDEARQNIDLGVRATHIRYMEAYEELKTTIKSIELADRNYLTVSTRYAEGMALITDLLDAANSRLDAGRRLVDARINIIYCYYKLLFNSGKI